MQEAVLLDRAAAALTAFLLAGLSAAVVQWRRNVRNLLGDGVLASDGRDSDVRGLAGLGESVVAAVEILALLLPRLQRMRTCTTARSENGADR